MSTQAISQHKHMIGLVCAYRLDLAGGARLVEPRDVATVWKEAELAWLHFDQRYPATKDWLSVHTGFDTTVIQFLLGVNPRPRALVTADAIHISLRGLSLEPGDPPEDMHSIQIWTNGQRIITCRERKSRAIADVRRELEHGNGPRNAGEMLARLAELLVTQMDDVISEAEEQTHALGHRGSTRTEDLVGELAHLRRRMIRLRRYLAPQRRALAQVATSRVDWLESKERGVLSSVADQTAEYRDGLDSALELAEITQDELLQQSSERTNRRLYMLTFLSAVFLPLTFITGLLGVNVAGIPDAQDPLAFAVLCGLLLSIGLIELLIFKRKGWF